MSASEINNNFYTVERSTDAINFEEIATINGAGNSSNLNSYYFKDINSPSGKVYYRLKQTDFNGNYKYFNVVEVNCSVLSEVAIFPNPSKGIFNINNISNENTHIIVYDVLGNIIVSYPHLNQEFVLDLSNHPKGTYFIKLISDTLIETHKLIVN